MNLLLSLGLAIGSKAQQTPMRGGVPLEANGEMVGASGVSAGSEDQDVAVAQAGAAAFGKDDVGACSRMVFRGSRLPATTIEKEVNNLGFSP